MAMDKVSVIIPSYNSEKTIGRCIESILETGYSPLEIIVVDDASKDNSVSIIETFCKEHPGLVRLVNTESNSGPAKARNLGAKQATGKYLFFLDSDTQICQEALFNFVRHIGEFDAVTGIYHYEPLNQGMVAKYKALLNYYFFSRKGPIEYEVFDSSRAGIKVKVFYELGGFNEQLSWGMDYENEEFGYRLCQKYRNLLAPDVITKHVFPGLWQLSKDYFFRVALWMEIYLKRKKFESGGVTSSQTGLSSVALLLAVISFFLTSLFPYLRFIGVFFLAIYIYGYSGFFLFVAQKKPAFLVPAIILNIYFTFIISFGAIYGLFKFLSGRPKIFYT